MEEERLEARLAGLEREEVFLLLAEEEAEGCGGLREAREREILGVETDDIFLSFVSCLRETLVGAGWMLMVAINASKWGKGVVSKESW